MAKLTFQGWKVLIKKGELWEDTGMMIRGFFQKETRVFISTEAAIAAGVSGCEFVHLPQHEGFRLKQFGLAKRLVPQYNRVTG